MHDTFHPLGHDTPDLAVAAVRAGRQLSRAIRRHRPPTGDLKPARLRDVLRRLDAGQVLDRRDDWVLESLSEHLGAALRTEIRGVERTLRPCYADAATSEWEVVEETALTERGERLAQVVEALEDLVHLRTALADHALATKTLRDLNR